MTKHIKRKLRDGFIRFLDFFYPLFSGFLPRQTYYYLACGGINTVNDWVMYYLIYNFVLAQHIVDLGFIAFSPHIAALIIVTPITFTVGFMFSKHVTFRGSDLHTSSQIFRYASVLAFNFVLSYLSMKFFCDLIGLWATPSKMLTTVLTTVASYFLQKYYSFKKQRQSAEE